ncbi:MAG: BamA/TamA family outer membrane protein, partial [Bacteroidia bacterium]
QLLVKNKIERGESYNVDLSDEKSSLHQKPNRELLGFIKFHLWAYQYGNKGLGIRKKQPWLRRTAEKVGEAPVLIDSTKMELSVARLSEYYFSKGFLENEVTYSTTPSRLFKKRACVIYKVDLKSYRTINSLQYKTSNEAIQKLLKKTFNQQKLKVAQRIDFDKIEAERNRVTSLLKNNGFYYFNSSYIDFDLDTNQVKKRVDVVVNIRDRKNSDVHYQQTIKKITVKIGKKSDRKPMLYDDINFIEGDYYIRPSALAKNIIFRPMELYDESMVKKTYSNLLSMGLFNFVTIRFRPAMGDSISGLEAEIILQTAPKHEFVWEPQAILTSQGSGIQAEKNRFFGSEQSVGLANVVSLSNRNVFGGAETFNISSLTALETQLKGDNQGVFSTFRQSFNTEFVIPSLVYFERKDFSQVYVKKSTKINASFLHDRNVNYTRNVIPMSYTYAFSKGRTSYGVTPFRLSINQASIEPNFLLSLDPATRNYTTQLLTNNIIAGPTASVFWSNKDINHLKYWQIRSNALELSGNIASAYFNWFTDEVGINKEIKNVKYSQYARSDIEVVFNHIINENNSFAYKAFAGAGYAYGNSNFLPFERRFFVGGGNSLRAWRPRTIGPGSYSDSNNVVSIEKTGEFMLQGNAEYRFDIIDKLLDGAVFVDAGNIWNFREQVSFDNAHFDLARFYKEIAINTGFGLRFDLNVVVFRMDWGIALHNPSKLEGARWVIKDFSEPEWIFDNTAVNFAIGFPF